MLGFAGVAPAPGFGAPAPATRSVVAEAPNNAAHVMSETLLSSAIALFISQLPLRTAFAHDSSISTGPVRDGRPPSLPALRPNASKEPSRTMLSKRVWGVWIGPGTVAPDGDGGQAIRAFTGTAGSTPVSFESSP